MTDNRNLQQRYDTAANFAASNRVLLAGEKAIESDTLKEKVGNGTTAYNALPYSFATQILAWVLTGISFASSAAVTAADTIRTAIGKLQAQISAIQTTKADVESVAGARATGSFTILNNNLSGTGFTIGGSSFGFGNFGDQVPLGGNIAATLANMLTFLQESSDPEVLPAEYTSDGVNKLRQ